MKVAQLAFLLVTLFLANLSSAEIAYPDVPESRWIKAEQAAAHKALSLANVDLLIIPLQSKTNSFDPIERSLITRYVASSISRSTNLVVANPTYVLKYLGSHRPTFSKRRIDSLAGHENSRDRLELYSEHDRSGRFELEAILIDGTSGEPRRTKTWPNLHYSDAKPPSVAIQGILGEIVEFAVGTLPKTRPAVRNTKFIDGPIPDSLEEVVNESRRSPLHSAAYLQFVGMLHPAEEFNNARSQLFERSLVQLAKVPDNEPAKRYFVARAYAYLDRRPAAIHALGQPKTAHERALLATLNGDLPSLLDEVAKMKVSLMDFMFWRDLSVIEYAYSGASERTTDDEFAARNPVWAAFIHRALEDASGRGNYSAATTKFGLEQLLPNDLASLQTLLNSAQVTGEYPDELELTRLVLRHIDTVSEGKVAGWAQSQENFLSVSELDIVDLARMTLIANHIRRIEYDLDVKHLPASALSKISEFDSIFPDHPAVTLKRGLALKKLASKSNRAESLALREEYAAEMIKGLGWTGRMTRDAADVARSLNSLRRISQMAKIDTSELVVGARLPELETFDPFYRYHEWPQSSAWHEKALKQEVDLGVLQSCVDYTWTQFYCLEAQIKHLEETAESPGAIRMDMFAKYSHRFAGNAQRAQFEIALLRENGGTGSVVKHLQSQIAGGSSHWPDYLALGRHLTREGRYQEAYDVFIEYPGFASSNREMAISISNGANTAGSMFYWIGQHEFARPLLEISALIGTGSEGNMQSGARMSLIDGDLESAGAWTAARVRRYGSKYAIRDLQQILHITGQSDFAWSVFDQVLSKSERHDSQLWSGALVGHRVAGATTANIVEWIEASELRRKSFIRRGDSRGSIQLAQRYLLLSGITDRAPGTELSDAMEQFRLDRPATYYFQQEPDPELPPPALMWRGRVHEDGRALYHDDMIPTPAHGQKAESRDLIDSRYEMIADAMSAFLAGDHTKSFELFNETAYYYNLEEFLAYYAFSAATIGNADHLSTALATRESAFREIENNDELGSVELGYRFNEDLTYAVLESSKGRHETALKFLKQALNNRPYIEDRAIYPYYQIADMADRMFEETGVREYREFSLDLARRHTVVLPMYSWAYFIVAKYSDSEFERIKATASGLSLDPLSYRATKLPGKLIEKARAYLSKRGAPYKNRNADSEPAST